MKLARSMNMMFVMMISVGGGLVSCISQQADDNLSYDEPTVTADESGDALSGFQDDLEIDQEASELAINENSIEEETNGFSPPAESLEQTESNSSLENQASSSGEEVDEFAEFEEQETEANNQTLDAPVDDQSSGLPDLEIADLDTPSDLATPSAIITKPASPLNINNIQFKANESGGTIIIDGDGPLQFTTRKNDRLKQFVIEIPYAKLPTKLQRTLNTRDLQGAVGSIDAYQSNDGTTRVVVQLREGSPHPVVTSEGNTLLVIASNLSTLSDSGSSLIPADVTDLGAVRALESGRASKGGDGVIKVLGSETLSDFMAGNTEFYGKKISIETSEEMEIRDAIKFIMEESGVNMLISEGVKGKMSLKLRQVPWDQALILIMRSNKLAYVRQGNVIRIATLEELRSEEAEAVNFANRRIAREPIKVRMFPVNYAKASDMATQVKEFLTKDRGKATSDLRTNTVIVTDLEENLVRIQKLIESLDQEPPQVLIEGKIVEAQEEFTRSLGVNWGYTGIPKSIGQSGTNPLSITNSFQSNPSDGLGTGLFNLNIGTLDIFGNLTATLSLAESENKAKILSSPRIVTMSNLKASINQEQVITVGQKVTPGTNGASPTTEPIRATIPLTLTVTPQITHDNSVLMEVSIERTFATIQTGTDPNINTRKANTNILVKNGETAVIGGIYQNDESVGENKIPVLGSIPVIGWLFKSRTTSINKNELMIFLTPRILTKSNGGKVTTITEIIPSSDIDGAGTSSE